MRWILPVVLALFVACDLPGPAEQEAEPEVTEALEEVGEEAEADLRAQRTGVAIRPVAPSGAIAQEVLVRIADDVFSRDLVGGPAPEATKLRVRPSVAGQLEVRDVDTVAFVPETGFAPETEYTVILEAMGPAEDVRTPDQPQDWSRTFTTPAFGFQRMALRERNPKANRITVELVFSGAVDADEVAARSSFALDGGPVGPTYHSAGDDPHSVRFVFAGRKYFQDVPLTASIERGVPLATHDDVEAGPGQAKVDLAAGQAMEILNARLSEGANGFYVDVICNDEAGGSERYYWDRASYDSWHVSERCDLGEEDAQEGLHFTPGVEFTVASGPAGFRVFGDFERGEYQMTLDAGTRTVDGGMLESTFETQFTVPERSPAVSFSAQGRYLPRSAWESLAIRHTNVEGVEVTVRHVPEDNLLFWMSGDEPTTVRTSTVVAQRKVPVSTTPDEQVTTWLDVDSIVPRAGKGIYEIGLRGLVPTDDEDDEDGYRDDGPTDFSRILLTDLQLVAKLAAPGPERDWTPQVRVWALGTHDQRPEGGVDVKIVRPSGQALGSCRTDFGGGCTIDVRADDLDDTPPMALVARKGGDMTYLKFDDVQVTPPAATHGAPYLDEQPYRASVYTDRGVYRPGDVAHVVALVRSDEHVAPRPNLPVVIRLYDPRSKELRKKVLHTNTAGMVDIDLPFADFATTGAWRVTAEIGEEVVGETTFNVEEFVPERMKVEAWIEGQYLATETVPVDVSARWLFGGSAEGSEVELTCSLVPGAFTPERNTSYHYGLAEVDEEAARRTSALGSVTGALGEGGEGTLNCPAASRSGGFLGAATLVAQAAVFEGDSGRTTLGEARTPVHPEQFYLGLTSSADKAKAGRELRVQGLVVDWDGAKTDAVDEVEVELVRLEAQYHYTWDPEERRYRYRRLLRRAQEDRVTAPVQDGEFGLALTPSQDAAGYLVVAEAGEARSELYVEGEGRRYWWRPTDTSVDQTPRPEQPGELTLEAPETVKVGDTLRVTTTVPYGGRMLWTTETHEVIEHRWLDVEPGEVTWEIPVEDFVPNLYVSAMVLKDPHLESDETYLPDRAYGVTSVRIRPDEYTQPLTLDVPDEVRPHQTLEVGIDVGPQEAPSYVTVAAVDEGILSLTDFESPDPFADIFAKRQLGVETYETIGWTMIVPPGGPSSEHGGGGMESGGRVQMVKPVALWSGVVEVPTSGKTKVSFDVPGYRGELRVMAVSASQQRMGHADAPVTVRDPIVVQSTLPRFLIAGDEAVLPVFVSNVSGQPRDITVSITTEDLQTTSEQVATRLGDEEPPPVVVVGDDQAALSLDDGASDTVLFRVRADEAPDAARFRVTATAGGLESYEELELPVERPEPEIRDTRKITLARGANDLTPTLQGWVPGSDHTRIWVTTNPYGEAFSHLRAVVRYPYGCIEQTTSSTRPLLYVSDLVEAVDPTLAAEAPLEEMVQHGIERIMGMQTPGGGFAYWPGGSAPNPWGTTYATHLLLDAKEAGYDVSSGPLDDALAYLEREADSRLGTYDGDYTTAYMHYVLAKAGRARTAQAQRLLEQLEQGTEARGHYRQLGEPEYLLQAAMYLGGDRRHESDLRSPDTSDLTNERRNDWSFWSDLRTRGFQLAVYHDLFGSKGAQGERLAQILGNGLAQHRSSWYTTQEMAWGITGLGKWISGGLADVGKPTLTVDGRTLEPEQVGADYVWSLSGLTAASAVGLDLSRTGGKTVYAVVSTRGVSTSPAPMGGSGLRLQRRILGADGKALDRASHQLGDPVFVEVKIKNTSDHTVQNIALVDRIPAGWEIENPRLGRGTVPDWYDVADTWQVDHMNLRDDRVEVFGALGSGEERSVFYQVRAVTAGEFTHPSPSAEAMYDPRVWARLPAGKVGITDPWGGS